ncbi:sugar phosphate nucleotidyltransferase [Euzebya rosea]|uniref:sugar phosphate nucleotidyltransferase n=1 Tax=Euzebya rosea TaxID=2052804 RepID=UPI000D3E4AB1|nr:NDP-sugar synthase [Euzebya rosea]
MRALILAGGRGTRLRPLTHLIPKPLVPFMGDPYAHGLLRRLVDAGVTRATFLVGRDAAPFQPLVDAAPQLGLEIDVATEEMALDTAGAVRRALADEPDEPVLVCNGDVLTDVDLRRIIDSHVRSGAVATLTLHEVADTSAFGVVVRNGEGMVRRFVEKPQPGTVPDNTINAGTYVLQPRLFGHFPGDGPLSFERQVFPGLLDAGERMLGVNDDAYWQDLGTPARYLEGHRAVIDGECAWPLAEGMVVVEGQSAIHPSAVVDETAVVRFGSVVGPRCRVGAGAVLQGAVLHEEVEVHDAAVISDALVGALSEIGTGVVVPKGSVLGIRTYLGTR